MIDVVRWWLVVQLLGLAALPVTLLLFRRLPDRGVFFARTLGLLVAAYGTWLLGSLHLVPYATVTPMVIAVLLFIGGMAAGRRSGTTVRRELTLLWRERRPVLVTGELLFTVTFLAWSRIRGYSPDITGTEKFMDFAFINAINRTRFFPPFDPWLSGATINYYYFGHLMMAMLIRLSGVPAAIGFNLAVPFIAALTATAAFALAANLWSLHVGEKRDRAGADAQATPTAPANESGTGEQPERTGAGAHAQDNPNRAKNEHAAHGETPIGSLLVGLAAAALCTLLGNLDGAGQMLSAPSTWAAFNWWTPSRVIPHTINEFPFFSFLLADLHAHVMAIPFGLLVVAIAMEYADLPATELLWFVPSRPAGAEPASGNGADSVPEAAVRERQPAALGIVAAPATFSLPVWCDRRLFRFVSAALALGILYFLNGWDYPSYALVLVVPLLARGLLLPGRRTALPFLPLFGWCAALAAASMLAILPFLVRFRPPTGGIGLVRDRTDLPPFLTIYGLFALLLGTWLLLMGLRTAVLTRRSLWLLAAGAVVILPLLDRARLDVLCLVSLGGLLAFWLLPEDRLTAAERFVASLAVIICLLLALEEVIHLRDVFAGGPDYRMNTVFKFGYVAWLLLSLACAFGLAEAWQLLHADLRPIWLGAVALLVVASLVYPILGTYSKSGRFAHFFGLNGIAYLRQSAPGDGQALLWLRHHVTGHPVILEAVGGEYSQYARVSTYTGLPTVLGWQGHESQWGHNAGTRAADVATIYRTTNVATARQLLDRYHVRYVFVGSLERARYAGGIAKFAQLGHVVFHSAGTAIYAVP